jgi:hypothetical protein
MTKSQHLSRRVLSFGAWTTLFVLSVALLATFIPQLGAAIVSHSDGAEYSLIGTVFGLVTAVGVLAVWIGGTWHALVQDPWNSTAPRWLVVALVILGNAVGGLLYYFLAVHWESRAHGAPH